MQPCRDHGKFDSVDAKSDNVRETMAAHMEQESACYKMSVQFLSEDDDLNNLLRPLDRKKSPFYEVAELTIPQQNFDSEVRATNCENLSFNPWRTIEEHRPLGIINEIRRVVYQVPVLSAPAQRST